MNIERDMDDEERYGMSPTEFANYKDCGSSYRNYLNRYDDYDDSDDEDDDEDEDDEDDGNYGFCPEV